MANPETCATAQALPTGQSMINFQADLRRAVNDVDGTCSSSGPELVYKLTLTQAQDVTVSIAKAPGQGTSDPVLFVRASPCDTGTELACADDTYSNATETVTFYNRPAGDLFIFVESYTSTYAVLTDVAVTLSGPTLPPTNDSCASPAPLTFSMNAATATGSLIQANNSSGMTDASPTCSSAARTTGRDVVYSFTTTAAQDIEVTVTPGATAFTPVVYLRTLANCADGTAMSELGCFAAAATGTMTRRFFNVPAGSYALWVDSAEAVDTTFNLGVQLLAPTLPPANDTCSTPQALTFTANRATTTGQTVAAASNYGSLACAANASASTPDVVYSYTVPASSDVTIAVAPANASYTPVLYTSAACPNAADLACALSSSTTYARPVGVVMPAQAAGTYTAIVDGNGTTGLFRLDARLGAPPNDACASAAPIQLSTAMTDNSVLETTQLSTNDFASMATACGSATRYNGRDLVYSFTAAASGTVTANIIPASNFDPVIAVMVGGCGSTYCTAAADVGASGGPETLSFSVTAGQTYYLVVDGYGTSSNQGFFRLELR